MSDQLPWIFILDIDGCIVGNVHFQVARYNLLQRVEEAGFKPPQPPKKGYYPHAYHSDRKLIRPGFGSFLSKVKKQYPTAEFFIYTASDKKWANQEIEYMENALGFKFRRPIFSRPDCIPDPKQGYKKSVKKVLPKIWRSLQREYSLSKADKQEILEKRLIVFDNSPVFTDFKDRLVLCPTYHYLFVEDILEGLDEKIRQHPLVSEEIRQLESEGLVYCEKDPKHTDPMHCFYEKQKWLLDVTKKVLSSNTVFASDQFWKRARKAFTSYRHRDVSKELMDDLKQACKTR